MIHPKMDLSLSLGIGNLKNSCVVKCKLVTGVDWSSDRLILVLHWYAKSYLEFKGELKSRLELLYPHTLSFSPTAYRCPENAASRPRVLGPMPLGGLARQNMSVTAVVRIASGQNRNSLPSTRRVSAKGSGKPATSRDMEEATSAITFCRREPYTMPRIVGQGSPLRDALLAGEACFGYFLMLDGAATARTIARVPGLKYVMIDGQHGQLDGSDIRTAIHAICAWNVSPMVRVPSFSRHLIERALDAGAHGIVVPVIPDAVSVTYVRRL